jgi:prepilin signal peptidase PulO-like enzyme (type II secretory pathway)
LFALLLAAALPWFRLPELVNLMSGAGVQPIHYGSSNVLPDWHHDLAGIAISLVIVLIWFFSLLPARYTLRYGLVRGIRLTLASIVRPKRKNACSLRSKDRQPLGLTRLFFNLWAIVSVLVLLGWFFLPATNWTSLFCAIAGLGFGGGMVWSIRIVASYAMQQEAMGFGDVTLMAMIGATLGWQATLIAFVYAMVVVVLGLVIQVILTGSQALAFGPYLCAGAAITIFRWDATWPGAREGAFVLGQGLLWILAGSLVLMAIMLLGLVWIKGLLGFVDEDEAG